MDMDLQERCRELVRRDRKRRPWMYAGVAVLLIAFLLSQTECLPQSMELPVLILCLCFFAVTFFRWWVNLFCPNCHRSLISRWNPYRWLGGASLWSSREGICYFCRTPIPFDEE